MKKYFKIFSIILVFVLMSFVSILNVHAETTLKITNKKRINSGIEDRRQTRFTTNKGLAYCITPKRSGPSEGSTLKLVNTTKGGGVAYILNKAGTSDTEYLVTQLALWKYHDNYMPSEYVRNPGKELVKRANALANEAKNNKNWTSAPTLKFEVASAKLAETSDRQNYKSGAIKAIATNNTTDIAISISGAPSGSKIVDANGKQINTVKKNQAFYIVVPASSMKSQVNITINASTKGKTTYVERYSTGNSSQQELVIIVRKEETVKASTKITGTPVVRKCEKVGNTYYGKDGKVVDQTTYSIQCEKHTCEKVGNVYFGRSGNQVDQTTYSIECEKHTCEKVGNVYFGKSGNQVTYDQFTIECEKHVCEKIGDKYFGPKGTEVTKDEYTLECEKHVCEKIGDTYFDKNGNKVTYEQYTIACERHTCEKIGDTYFGKDGNQIDYDQYTIECEPHKCEFVNNNYFGKNGNIVTEEQYESECVHICEIYDNHYYGKWGDVVSPEDYKAQCEAQVVPVPDTANTSPLNLLYIVLGSALLGGTIGVITHFASNKAY